MKSKVWGMLLLVLLAMAAAVGLISVMGCALDKNLTHPQNLSTRIGGHAGQIIEPKRCFLRVAILRRPFGEPAINEAIWRAADEQVVAPAERRAWEVNGLRIGRVIGDLPPEIDAILRDTSPQKRVDPSSFFVENGEQSLISVSEPVDDASILLNLDNRVFGKPFKDVSGFLRVTAAHEGASSVSLRLLPELHHGPIQRSFQAMPNAAGLAPQQLRIHDGQQEDTLRDLAVNVLLEPGQVAVVGCRPEQKRTVGTFLFTQAEAHSERRYQKLILIWASRNLQGVIDAGSQMTDRPRLFKRKIEKAPAQPVAQPPDPAPLPELNVPLSGARAPGPNRGVPTAGASTNQSNTKSNGPNVRDPSDQSD